MAAVTRPHTGRRRNEAVREAILGAAVRLLESGDPGLSIEAVAAAAAVGKQTIYRWWPTKSALIVDAIAGRARVDRPADTGDLASDLDDFLVRTFRVARQPVVANALRALAADAQSDDGAANVLRSFTAVRRDALGAVFQRARERGQVSDASDIEVLVDQAFGVLWYRLLVGSMPITNAAARALARGLSFQAAAASTTRA